MFYVLIQGIEKLTFLALTSIHTLRGGAMSEGCGMYVGMQIQNDEQLTQSSNNYICTYVS